MTATTRYGYEAALHVTTDAGPDLRYVVVICHDCGAYVADTPIGRSAHDQLHARIDKIESDARHALALIDK